MSVKTILKQLSDGITYVFERIFIFYPTGKSNRTVMNAIYLIGIFCCAMTIISYDYTPTAIETDNTQLTQNNSSLSSYFNMNTSEQLTDVDNIPTVIEKPRFLVEDRNIRLAVGVIVAYFIISLLYSNTLHTKLTEFDNKETLIKVANGDDTPTG